MRKFIAVALLLLGMASLAAAQAETPAVEIFGGYSLFHFDDQDLETDVNTAIPGSGFVVNKNLHGWEAAVQFNATKSIGIVADFSGHYGTLAEVPSAGVSGNIYNFLFGPQFNYRTEKATIFAHALFGGNRLGVDSFTIPVVPPATFAAQSDTAFAMAFGGGLDFNATKKVAIRVAQFDYIYTNHTFSDYGFDLPHQNNFRFSAGLVLKLGNRK